jgi:predicted esterase
MDRPGTAAAAPLDSSVKIQIQQSLKNGRPWVAISFYFRLMQSHDLSFDFKGRYYTLGELTPSTKSVWFVLHGYGQLAAYFIRKFDILKDNNTFVIAPEGLSRFYVDPLQSTGRASDRVGATWMTKENRLVDIENYINYLNKLFSHVQVPPSIPVTVFGFSQGAATVSRWIIEGKISFNRMILWSGIFPPDMNIDSTKEILRDKEVVLVHGKKDPFLDNNQFGSMETIVSKLEIHPRVISFEGGHEIPEDILKELI